MIYPQIFRVAFFIGCASQVANAGVSTVNYLSEKFSTLIPHNPKVVIQNNTGKAVIWARTDEMLYTSEGQFREIILESDQLLILEKVPSALSFSLVDDEQKREFGFAGFNAQDKKKLYAGKKHAWVKLNGFSWGSIDWGEVESSTQFIPHSALPELLDPSTIQMYIRNEQADTIVLSTSSGQRLLTKKGLRKEITLESDQSILLERIPSDLYFSFKNDTTQQLFKIDSEQKQKEHPVKTHAGRRNWAISVEIGRVRKGPKQGELDIYMGNVVRDWR